MATLQPGLRLYAQPHPSVEWTTDKPDGQRCATSEDFAVGDSACYLSVRRPNDRCELHFHVRGDDPPAEPFQVTAFLSSGGEGLCRPQTSTISRVGGHLVWESETFHSRLSAKWFETGHGHRRGGRRRIDSQRVAHQHQSMRRFWVVLHTRRRSDAGDVEKSVQTPAHLDAHVKFEALSDGSSKLLNEGPTQDVEITCGSCSFRAHGSLLSARSEVFAVMLQSDMLEGKTRQVRIRDIEADLFGQFLGYLYSGKLPDLTVERAKQLFEVADKYAVQDLKEQCASFLADNLSKDNACEILILADRHSDLVLKESAVLYILEEKVPLRGRIWSEFADSHPELAVEVYKRFHK